ncbi:unnamed protein product [Prunus armeniaca]
MQFYKGLSGLRITFHQNSLLYCYRLSFKKRKKKKKDRKQGNESTLLKQCTPMDREKAASINSPGVPKALSKVDKIIQGKGEEDERMLPEEKALKPYTLHCHQPEN